MMLRMTDSPLARKLLIRPGHRILVLNAPEGYVDRLDPLPEGATVSKEQGGEPAGSFNQVHLFVGDRAQLQRDAAAALALAGLEEGGVLWACYPKGGKADINRDRGWEPLLDQGWHQVTQVSIDETWSALRFRPLADIGK
jgi:hypothetical protein